MPTKIRSMVNGIVVSVLAAGVGLGAAGCGQDTNEAAAPSAHRSALDGLLDKALAAGIPGVLIRIDDGSGKPYSAVRQAPWSVGGPPLTSGNEFRMGSNTKTLTAVIVVQLVDEGRLTLDDPVEKWLPGAVPNGAEITVRMLLNHTSGLADYATTPGVLQAMAGLTKTPPTTDELLAAGVSAKPHFPPGKGYSYSNTGYIALGMIAEKITGKSFPDLVDQRIAKPLGLTATYLPDGQSKPSIHGFEPNAENLKSILPPGTPEGFGFTGPAVNGDWVDVTAIDQSWDGAAGAIVSTSDEWAVIDHALMSGKLVPAPLLAEMKEVVAEDGSAGPGRGYGLGLEKFETTCGPVWGHDGALPGYRSDNYTDATGKHTFSVLMTTHFGLVTQPEAGKVNDAILDAAACLMMGQPVPGTK